MRKVNLAVLLAFLGILLVFTCGAYLVGVASAAGSGLSSSSLLADLRSSRDESLVSKAMRMLESQYYMEISPEQHKQVVYGALEGMFSPLRQPPFNDQFSHFYGPELYKDLEAQTTGEYVGIGVLMGPSADGMYPEVEVVFDNTPAAEQGLEVHDIISEVEGEDTFRMMLPEVATKIKGKPGTRVKLKIFRPADGEFRSYEIERRDVQYSSVSKAEMLDGGVGFIQLANFSENTAADFRAAMEKLSGQGMRSLVIDLRNNTGGLLDSAVAVADCFIAKGPIVEVDLRGYQPDVRMADTTSKKYSLPIVVLINAGTASASEVLTGCLQDYAKDQVVVAKIVGEKSYGKGVVQQVEPLERATVVEPSDGQIKKTEKVISALAITIGKYFTPNHQDIHGKGINPDIWYDVNTRLAQDPKLKSFDDRLKAKRDEMNAIRTELNQYLRANDAEKHRAWEVAAKLARGEDVPNVAQVKPAEEEHSPMLSAAPEGGSPGGVGSGGGGAGTGKSSGTKKQEKR